MSRKRHPIVVLKFGSSVLDRKQCLSDAVLEIYREVREGKRVLAVVSAFPGVTDWLFATAQRCFEQPKPSALASLVSTGETASAAFLGMALDQAGIPAWVLDTDQIGLEIRGDDLDADPVSLDVEAVEELFEQFPVLILPGFVGRAAGGSPALMGRGGSDLTALFAAQQLDADECRLLKDVDAMYDADPVIGGSVQFRYASAPWDEVLRVGGRLVQPKAVNFAKEHGVRFTLASPLAAHKTRIGPDPVRHASPSDDESGPVRVALLGLGTVGLGVYKSLLLQRYRFQVVGIAVQDRDKPREVEIPPGLLFDDPWSLLERPADVVVELIGGQEPAVSLIRASLELGRHVVTGNKEVVARHGVSLERIASASGVTLAYSASVGGAVPVLEQVKNLAARGPIGSIEGVLNGTCNYVLQRLAEGRDLDEAVREAQERGFAESDPTSDLSGRDSVNKLVILAKQAFGITISSDDIPYRGIEGLDSKTVQKARARGRVIKLVAACRKTNEGIQAEVHPAALPMDHPLAGARGEENRIRVEREVGEPVLLHGKGAGRWPTSLSVIADLLDLHRSGARSRCRPPLVSAVEVSS